MNKQPGSTLSTTMNGSQSCYITVKRFAFLSVETTLARTIHISNNILNWFWTLSKNVNLWVKRQEKGFCLIFKRNIAHLAHRRTLLTLIIASAESLKNLLYRQSLAKHFVYGQYTPPMKVIVRRSYPQSGVNALHIVIALSYSTMVCNIISVLVEMVNFAMIKVNNFCDNKMTAM